MSARLDIIGAGAFGTALAITYAQAGHEVTLWAREGAAAMQAMRENVRRLPGHTFPEGLRVTGDLSDLTAECALLALPTQTLGAFLAGTPLSARTLISCAKGIDVATGLGPTGLIARHTVAMPAQLTGPSFAVDIAAGLPTALTLACADDDTGAVLQTRLSTPHLRLYRTTDVIGAELGGALKNVIAIAAGAVIGAGYGDSARAALMTRGLAEMTRIAVEAGAQDATLTGLSGLGDLILTCGSDKSRNFRYGLALARGKTLGDDLTIEGLHTAREIAVRYGEEMPIAAAVAALADGRADVAHIAEMLFNRPLKAE
ncbi:NAD(P)H-dependent glycerol-3-phosphate dehydrogenase [Roseicyclus mahoneyensis]|jgi:glycerol-3-phosphate dehydrogenase (NAD(P)+)|uniref:Glycerol-3-phosphate dehydrogenase [NAD(P)+] n=1 Tax=Roseicyclus mahoneyensis TaxID=164332 RepID=A0A316GPJ6_9RHOB|nr:NAD(P)H-dependent glycerol-3-phosphate dehydrogenase [Roseicyclus mahoneyensis]PWK61414.1 glycerol-3-phosphate dehydrogenase (NAD(P)+) [Roseicyclus mahoneyensis]